MANLFNLFYILLLILAISPQYHQYYHRPKNITSARIKRICPGVHIRNDLKSFQQLKDCEVIDGPLTIALVSNQTHPYEPKDYENIEFPDLVEITDYLLFFRVQGLTTFHKLFPNLGVIRGRELVSNYALIIYEMMHLQRINLPSLTDILQGSVRIESNPNLCNTHTVNWEAICKKKYVNHFIIDNNKRCDNRCPDNCHPWDSVDTKSATDSTTKSQGDIQEFGAANNKSLFCWTNQVCHEPCTGGNSTLFAFEDTGCCSHQCAGGCSNSSRADLCVACRSVLQGEYCVESCASNLFEHKGRCIDERECEMMIEIVQQNQCSKEASIETSNFKAIRPPGEKQGKCQTTCPPGSEEDATNRHKCKPCDKGKCRKVCTPPHGIDKPYMVTNIKTLKEVSGCNVINGSLEISMKGGRNVLTELEMAFQDLEQIKGYLKITRSSPIITLQFFKNLRAINGSELDRGQYSLVIVDNPNLQELFMFNATYSNQKPLTISGKIFAHLNQKLCPNKIEALKRYADVSDWDEGDVSVHSNGDKEACNVVKLEVHFLQARARNAIIEFQNYARQLEDPRALLYYLINYREAANGTVTMFDGRDGCNSQNDVWTTVEEAPHKQLGYTGDYQKAIIKVKPATRYALYVKTFTIFSGSTGALSDMIYFESAPDTPGIPRNIKSQAINYSSVSVAWSPPAKPNGKIVRYMVIISRVPELEDFQNLDVCTSIRDRGDFVQTLPKDESDQKRKSLEPQISSLYNETGSSEAFAPQPTCSRQPETDPDTQVEQVTFQDTIIDIVYLKQPCVTPLKPVKRRRSIEHDPNVIEGRGENSVPRPVTVATPTRFMPPTTSMDIRSIPEPANNKMDQFEFATIRFNSTREKNEHNISAEDFTPDSRPSYTISGLHHYSLYNIEIVACHGDFTGKNTTTLKSYSKCGLQAITQVRTAAVPENDYIGKSSIIFTLANETYSNNIVTWSSPDSPNGLILAYNIRYRFRNSDAWVQRCINSTAYERERGIVLADMSPGNYLLSVQAVTMYPSLKHWSEEIEFEIPRDSPLSPAMFTLLIVLCMALVIVGILSGAYCFHRKPDDELIYASVNPDYVQYDPDEWEVAKSNLVVGPQIGLGSFGVVLKGQLITEKGMKECAIKTVSPTSTAKQRMDFLREASMMKKFDTFHVVKLLGVVSITTPVYVVMEYMANGDLKDFLRNQRELHQKQGKILVDGIYLMAAQIADGMAYLAAEKFIHRDLAARNCMVGENRVVKIGDFGLTRDVYINDYYRRDTSCRLPVRWMAPESLKDNMYTTASDVWSYGIVLWEMITFSAYPYQGLSNDEVIKRVISGYTLPRPENSPDKLWTIMEKCWRKSSKDRPSFLSIVEYLLPDTEGKLQPNCFYRKPTVEGDSIAQTVPEEMMTNGTTTESYPLLSWPSNNHRANGIVINSENNSHHINHHNHISANDGDDDEDNDDDDDDDDGRHEDDERDEAKNHMK